MISNFRRFAKVQAADAPATEIEAPELEPTWHDIAQSLEAGLGQATYSGWIMELTYLGVDSDPLRLLAPPRFIAKWEAG
ncbi:DnaA N-terminal domain-containing protein [Dongia soli]|uniref:DnaA N-terminal domain-containing protein n=1 Tax=Dongia soli TaxID=600628 RepID=UPI00360B2B7B